MPNPTCAVLDCTRPADPFYCGPHTAQDDADREPEYGAEPVWGDRYGADAAAARECA